MSRQIKIGCLLSPKDRKHVGLYSDVPKFVHGNYEFIRIDESKSILDQGPFDFIIHKISDYIKRERNGDKIAAMIIKELTELDKDKIVLIDDPITVLNLADRSKMFQLMDKCRLKHNGITVDVPSWIPLFTAKDIDRLKSLNFRYPIICKALCAGEGPGGHSMQIVFNPEQLAHLNVFPCVAQEFKNHDGIMTKIFVFGHDYFISTRPSVRNFPVNGQPNQLTDTICFDSHDVAKLTSKTFLNNFQSGFIWKNSVHGDKILDENVVRKILWKLACHIDFTFIGIDIIVTDNGTTYNMVDVNYLPSYDGLEDKLERLVSILQDSTSTKKKIEYWEN